MSKFKKHPRRSTWKPGPHDGRILRGYATMMVAILAAITLWQDGQEYAAVQDEGEIF